MSRKANLITVKGFHFKEEQVNNNNMYAHCLFKAFKEFLEAETKNHQNSIDVFSEKVKAARLIFSEDKEALSENFNPFA